MGLKKYLEKTIGETIDIHKRGLRRAEASLVEVTSMSPRNANYSVGINSAWTGGSYPGDVGETDTNTKYKGTLKSAIIEAEKEFKEINHRSDVQASYSVRIYFGEDGYRVPEKYWSKFIQRNRLK